MSACIDSNRCCDSERRGGAVVRQFPLGASLIGGCIFFGVPAVKRMARKTAARRMMAPAITAMVFLLLTSGRLTHARVGAGVRRTLEA